ncbi:MAG: polysaccharide deacetylase family protein [bacterium]|jgi:peptidoglycan/xylan/chitin deacetylase (PgdA/CDA1 family)
MAPAYLYVITSILVCLTALFKPLYFPNAVEAVQPQTGFELVQTEKQEQLRNMIGESIVNKNPVFGLGASLPVAAKIDQPPLELAELIYHGDAVDKVALTFDDGPYPERTEQYLKVLAEYGVKATFFVVGERVEIYPEQLQSIYAQGCEIGSHSWDHSRLDKAQPQVSMADLEKVRKSVYRFTGQDIKFVRPPYGCYSQALIDAASELGQHLVLWNVDPRDWEDPKPEEIVSRVMGQVKPGSIIILHEGKKNTLEALPVIIEKLRERGLEPVSVSQLLLMGKTN